MEDKEQPHNSSESNRAEGKSSSSRREATNARIPLAGDPLGLDVGTSRIVLAAGPGPQHTSSQLNAFVAVPYSSMVEDVLKQRNMIYDRNGKDIYVYGNDVDFIASFLNTVPRRPMQHGVLNARENMGQHIMRAIIKRLLPPARKGESLCFSVPGQGEGAGSNLVYHEAVLKNLLQSFGYKAKAINEGQAVVFSELAEENFTGVGISCGGGMCNVAVSFMAMPVITFSTPKAGDYIDSSAAEVLNETSTRVRLFKEESLDLAQPPRDELNNALHIYYEDVLQTLINRLREEFEGSRNLPKFKSMLKPSEFPVKISDIRLASDPLTSTALGCHIAAKSEAA
ncbi:MAG: hypothetical protein M3362_28490 [Acidobacteriota bacterium]|nr:hypothetical protein [Acidobacteriota bacterium]